MNGSHLAIFGTGSEVGKSLITTGLCRILRKEGRDVAPFKSQNMSNNSAPAMEGGEIGRSQATQARAAGQLPSVHMNPILLKPSGPSGSQVIVQGEPKEHLSAEDYYRNTDQFLTSCRESFRILSDQHDTILVEGAGSCCEMNLKDREISNFGFTEELDLPVILVADIHRGGVFAQVVGTLELLPSEQKQSIRGIVINNFRGDPDLFDDGITFLERRTGKPVLGLVPYDREIQVDAEDTMTLDDQMDPGTPPPDDRFSVCVVCYPHISNFTDVEILQLDPRFSVQFRKSPRSLKPYDAVVLPGTKNVREDLKWLKESGWASRIDRYVEGDGRLWGICGGFQMMGSQIRDPRGIEGDPGETDALSFFPFQTELRSRKIVRNTAGYWGADRIPVRGYEIHMGVTRGTNDHVVPLQLETSPGDNDLPAAAGHDHRVWGCYLHGLFDTPEFRNYLVRKHRPDLDHTMDSENVKSRQQYRRSSFEKLETHIRSNLNLDHLHSLV